MVKLCGMYIPHLHKSLVYPSIEKKASSSESYPGSPFAVLKMYIIESIGAGFMGGSFSFKNQFHKAKVYNFMSCLHTASLKASGDLVNCIMCHASIGHQVITGHVLTAWSWNLLTGK